MKRAAALTVIAALLALISSGAGAEAKTVKYRVKDHNNDNWKLSCNTARHMVRERGYNPVKVKSCITTPYAFYAARNGRTYIVRVHQRTGFVWRE